MPAERERFPVPDEAIALGFRHLYGPGPEPTIEMDGPELVAMQGALEKAAPHLVRVWIDGLTDEELLSLKFAGKDWCAQMRSELRRLAGDPPA